MFGVVLLEVQFRNVARGAIQRCQTVRVLLVGVGPSEICGKAPAARVQWAGSSIFNI